MDSKAVILDKLCFTLLSYKDNEYKERIYKENIMNKYHISSSILIM